MTRDEIRDILKENVCEVVFTKADGTERVMVCTLIPDYLPIKEETANPKSPRKINENFVSVWEIGSDSWKGFKVDSVKSVEVQYGYIG